MDCFRVCLCRQKQSFRKHSVRLRKKIVFANISEILRTLSQTIRMQGTRFTHSAQLHLHHKRNKSNFAFQFKGNHFPSRRGTYQLLRKYPILAVILFTKILKIELNSNLRSTFK